jgi:hypothetical protein
MSENFRKIFLTSTQIASRVGADTTIGQAHREYTGSTDEHEDGGMETSVELGVSGSRAHRGGLQGEMLVTVSVTGQILGAAVDRRVGSGSIETADQWQWGDAEFVMNTWSEMAATRLVNLTSGKAIN